MKRRVSAQSGFSNPRAAITLLVCAVAACWIITGTLLAFFRPEAPANSSQRTLAFEQRVAYQRAIEEVYWRNRIWPKERPDPKPSVDAVMSQAQLEKKVADYLHDSQALEDYSHHRITAEQLQAEMDRMAQHTKQPEVLRELFEALDNDPFIVAECLGRPILSEHLRPATVEWRKASLDCWKPGAENQIPKLTSAAKANYTLPAISGAPKGCIDDTWRATSTTGAPSAREDNTAVWTGTEMIIWGGYNGSNLNTGGRYNPSTDSWTATSTTNAPSGRVLHTAVWTGSEMIVWGGFDGSYLATGGRYNPTTDSWTASSIINAPAGRYVHTAVWTGSEMVVWGGISCAYQCYSLNTGGRYNPSTDSWTPTSTTNVPSARVAPAVWSGSEMIVWGGTNDSTGGRYNPSTDSWTATNTTNAPSPRGGHTAVWTGGEMIVWGGRTGCCTYYNTGGRYNPSTDSWTTTSTTNAPAPGFYTEVWTDSEMIVWGGVNSSLFLNTGGTYPAPFAPPTPAPRFLSTSLAADTPAPTNTPTATATVTASPTPFFGTGGRYDPGTDSWRATSTTNAPTVRVAPAVWTGSEMIVWGGAAPFATNTGGRYCAQFAPPTPTPTATPTATLPPSPTPTLTPAPTTRPTPIARPRPSAPPRP